MGDELRTSGNYVASLASAVMKGGEALGAVPDLLKIVLEEESWRRFVTPRGEIIEHHRFADFATTPPLAGIGADIALLRRIVADDPTTVTLLEDAVRQHGGDRRSPDAQTKHNNVMLERPKQGNTAGYALSRLEKQRPDLHERVEAGELSANAAAIQAGFRKRTISIPTTDPEKAAASIRRNMRPEDIRVLIDYLEGVS